MTDTDKPTPKQIAAAIHETVRTLNEHLAEAYETHLIANIETYSTHTANGIERMQVAASVSQKL